MEYHYTSAQKLIDVLMDSGFIVRTKVLSQETNKGYIYAVKMTKK